MEGKTGSVDFLAGFFVGALVGAAAAFLFAPQSGEETRTLIRDKGLEMKERAGDLQEQATEKATEYQTKVKQAVDEGKTAAAQKREELLAQVGGASPAVEVEAET